MAKKKIIGYFQLTQMSDSIYILVTDKKTWDSYGDIADLVDEKIYDAMPTEFWEISQCVFESNLNLEETKNKLNEAGLLEKILTEDITDWLPDA